MLVYNRLPLYIALFYPVVISHICMTIRRYEFSRTLETISTAFYAGILYMIFDNMGPMLNWWIWDRADPTTWPYLSAVPVTSYFWWFSFTGAFALVNRIIRRRDHRHHDDHLASHPSDKGIPAQALRSGGGERLSPGSRVIRRAQRLSQQGPAPYIVETD